MLCREDKVSQAYKIKNATEQQLKKLLWDKNKLDYAKEYGYIKFINMAE